MNGATGKLRGKIMSELNNSIIKWINALPDSDQDILDTLDLEVELFIELLKEGKDLKRIRELYRKLSDDLDKEENLY